MKNPFIHFDKAFDPMFSEDVILTLKDGKKQTISTCIFDDTTGDALSDDSVDTTREDIQLVFKKNDIAFLQRVSRGDTIERVRFGKKYKVSESKHDDIFTWIIKARSI